MLVSLKCPECNGNLSVENDREIYFCPYCGAKVVQEHTSNIINNYYGDAINPDVLFERWVNTWANGGDVCRAEKAYRDACYDDYRYEIVDMFSFQNVFDVKKNDPGYFCKVYLLSKQKLNDGEVKNKLLEQIEKAERKAEEYQKKLKSEEEKKISLELKKEEEKKKKIVLENEEEIKKQKNAFILWLVLGLSIFGIFLIVFLV